MILPHWLPCVDHLAVHAAHQRMLQVVETRQKTGGRVELVFDDGRTEVSRENNVWVLLALVYCPVPCLCPCALPCAMPVPCLCPCALPPALPCALPCVLYRPPPQLPCSSSPVGR